MSQRKKLRVALCVCVCVCVCVRERYFMYKLLVERDQSFGIYIRTITLYYSFKDTVTIEHL